MADKNQIGIPELLKLTLLSLMETVPIHKIYVTQVCKLCHINRATFYDYYDDIFDLLRDIEKDIVSELCSILDNADVTISNSSDIAKHFFTYLYEHRIIVRALLSNGNHTNFALDMNDVLIRLLKNSVYIQYDIPEDFPEQKLNDILEFIVFGHYAFYMKFFFSKKELDVDMITEAAKLCSELSEACLRNYLTPKIGRF